MAMVKFATTCDAQTKRGTTCHKRSEEYTAWPDCRSCGAHVCEEHEPAGTRREDDSDDADGVARMRISVMCPSCLESEGPDEYCVAPEEDTRDAAYEQADREYGEAGKGGL